MKLTNTDAPFLHLLAEAGLPAPVQEYRFHPSRRWRFDYAWVGRWECSPDVALEVEGGTWVAGRHVRGMGYLNDMEKYNEAVALGWRVLRCTPDTLNDPRTVGLVRDALRGGFS